MRSHCAAVALLAVSLCAHAEGATEAARPGVAGDPEVLRIAIYDIDGSGMDERVRGLFVDALAVELKKLRAVDVITMAEIRTMLDLEANKQMMGCSSESSCLAEIADALGAAAIVSGSVASVGGETVVGLQRIAQQSATVTQRYQARLQQANGEELLAAIGPAVTELFPDLPLRSGETRGVDPRTALLLNPPPLPAWAFWTTVGTGAALTVAGGGLMLIGLAPYEAGRDAADASASVQVSGRQLKELYDTGNSSYVAGQWVGAAGLVVLGVSVSMAFLTDFDDVAAAQRNGAPP